MPHLCFFCKEPALSLSKGGRRCSRALLWRHRGSPFENREGEHPRYYGASPPPPHPHPRLHALVHRTGRTRQGGSAGHCTPPLFRLRDQASFYRVLMDVVQLLLRFCAVTGQNHRTVVAKCALRNRRRASAQWQLGPQPSQYAPCEALFDGLHHRGRLPRSGSLNSRWTCSGMTT